MLLVMMTSQDEVRLAAREAAAVAAFPDFGRPPAVRRRYGYCKRGHALAGDNVYVWGGHHRCKTCHRDYVRGRYRASRPSVLPPGRDRTRCKHGHPLDDAYVRADGSRRCRQCHARRERERLQRRKQEREHEVSYYQDDEDEDCCGTCGRSVSTLFARNSVVTITPNPDGSLGMTCDACYDPATALAGMGRYLAQKEHRAARERARRAAAEYIERPSFDLSALREGYGDGRG